MECSDSFVDVLLVDGVLMVLCKWFLLSLAMAGFVFYVCVEWWLVLPWLVCFEDEYPFPFEGVL